MPAPSPVLTSQPQAPRWLMRRSISSASVTVRRCGSLDSSAQTTRGALWWSIRRGPPARGLRCCKSPRFAADCTRHKADATGILVIFGIEEPLGFGDSRVLAHHLQRTRCEEGVAAAAIDRPIRVACVSTGCQKAYGRPFVLSGVSP